MKKIGIVLLICFLLVSAQEGATYTGPSKTDQEDSFESILAAIGVTDPSGFISNYCEANGVTYNAGHARSVQRTFTKACEEVENNGVVSGRQFQYSLAKIELIGALHPIAKYFLECDRDSQSPYQSILVGLEQITRVAKMNAIWQHEDETGNLDSMVDFGARYPDETDDFVDACQENDWDLTALIKYAQGDYLTSFIPSGTPFVEFLHNVYWASVAPQMNSRGIATVNQYGCGDGNYIFPCVDVTQYYTTVTISRCMTNDMCLYKSFELYYNYNSSPYGCVYLYYTGPTF